MMRASFFLFFLLLCFISCNNKRTPQANNEKTTPQKIRVYLLGTFHFAQMDANYNVLDDKHQKSIEKLSRLVALQKPDKVFVERQPEYESRNKIDSLYGIYLTMARPIKARNEIFQIGFRIAKYLGHKKVYQCDHPGQYGRYVTAVNQYAENNHQNDILNSKRLGTVMRYDLTIDEDSLAQNSTLLEYLQWLNSEEVMTTSHGYYITNFPQIGSNNYYDYNDDDTLIGAELTSDWYHRNIMIYTKMINQIDYKSDKAIFLLMGSDHIPIIEDLFDANPHFKVIKPDEWLYE